jgi:hypothetical protein
MKAGCVSIPHLEVPNAPDTLHAIVKGVLQAVGGGMPQLDSAILTAEGTVEQGEVRREMINNST